MTSSVGGDVEPGYESVRDAFAAAQARDAGGAQLAVYRHGHKVVDNWTGTNVARSQPYPGDGLQMLTSATKGVASITAHLLAQRGLLELDAPGNGIGDARSLAKLYAATIGEVESNPRVLGAATVAAALAPQTDRLGLPGSFAKLPDRHPLRLAIRFEIHRTGNPMLGSSSFGHTGAGGRLAFADPDTGIAVGYVCNNMLWDYAAGPDARWPGWLNALRTLAART